MIELPDIEHMTVEQLKAYGAQIGVKTAGNFGRFKLMQMINNHLGRATTAYDALSANLEDDDEQIILQDELRLKNQERVNKLLGGYISRGLKIDYHPESFTINWFGRMDSFNYSVPNGIIAQKVNFMAGAVDEAELHVVV